MWNSYCCCCPLPQFWRSLMCLKHKDSKELHPLVSHMLIKCLILVIWFYFTGNSKIIFLTNLVRSMAGNLPSFESNLKSFLALPFNLMHSGQLYYLDPWKVEDVISTIYGTNQGCAFRFYCHVLGGVKITDANANKVNTGNKYRSGWDKPKVW